MSNATATAKEKRHSSRMKTMLWRAFLTLFTFLLLSAGALAMAVNLVFTGPSPTARDLLAASLSQSQVTAWIPSAFLGGDVSQGG